MITYHNFQRFRRCIWRHWRWYSSLNFYVRTYLFVGFIFYLKNYFKNASFKLLILLASLDTYKNYIHNYCTYDQCLCCFSSLAGFNLILLYIFYTSNKHLICIITCHLFSKWKLPPPSQIVDYKCEYMYVHFNCIHFSNLPLDFRNCRLNNSWYAYIYIYAYIYLYYIYYRLEDCSWPLPSSNPTQSISSLSAVYIGISLI